MLRRIMGICVLVGVGCSGAPDSDALDSDALDSDTFKVASELVCRRQANCDRLFYAPTESECIELYDKTFGVALAICHDAFLEYADCLGESDDCTTLSTCALGAGHADLLSACVVTPEECRENGGTVIEDPGGGSTHREGCPEGRRWLARVWVGLEGGICCQ